MIRIVQKLVKSDSNRKLSSNILSLGALQIFTYILPLLTFPYLVRVLGMEKFGLLGFVTAVTTYFLLVSDYGFNLTATKQISDFRGDRERYSRIFYEVIAVKLLIVSLSLLVLTLLVMTFEFFWVNALIYYLTFGVVLGHALFPVWFFQGMEAMKKIAIINIITKTSFTGCIFFFVRDESDYWIVPLLTSVGFIAGGSFAFASAVRSFNIEFSLPTFPGLKFQVVNGWHVFLSRIYVNLYTATNIVLLGLLTNNTVVGAYSIAEKMLQAFSGLFSPVNQAFYPFLAKTYRDAQQNFFKIFKSLNIIFFAVSSVLSIAAFLFSERLVSLVAGTVNNEVVFIFSILCAAIMLAPFGSSFTNAFLVLGCERKVSMVVMCTMIFNFILILPLILYFGAAGLAIAWVLGQIFHVFLYLYEYQKLLAKVGC